MRLDNSARSVKIDEQRVQDFLLQNVLSAVWSLHLQQRPGPGRIVVQHPTSITHSPLTLSTSSLPEASLF